ncbi:phosphoenolpyruvate/phosphate translocator precursor [Plasmodium ovale wallikeri]|uniref:Phosphoenolpyruvate/phosphate translocator n=2 Tax=Plasmodium ovale TaxID=36330 RepID=A0A1A8YWK6_PLAOA|nr:phosphoenolpyruvate/phosphate translocator precursor [Plasmodium ovale wallikeri]SBT36348.1 phosphoenolpyruvate/phosphate translocator precursor [Plasmodium ovale wallikeri]SBT77372.1 phosphoenolpyruvate/phosphate translocator, putative [Plasmodium ovale]
MKLLVRILLFVVAINIQFRLGRCLSYDNQNYAKSSSVNFHCSNPSGIIKKAKTNYRIHKNKNKSKNSVDYLSLFLNNYQPKYEKIKKSNQSNFNITDAHQFKVKTKQTILNSLKSRKNDGRFILFNNSISKDSNIYDNNHLDNNKIIDDISSPIDNDYASDGKENANTTVKTLLSSNSDGGNLGQKKACTFLNKFVEGGKTVSLLGLWYVCNIFYNIENKKALNILNLPVTIAIAQIYVGLPIFLIPWLLKLRKQPELFYDENELKKISLSDRNALIKAFQKYKLFLKKYSSIMKQSIYHGYAHLLSVIAMGAGAISFVHIVKASSPLFAALFSFFLTNNRMSIYTYSSLLPIVFGVSLASIKELSFTYKALYSTLSANVLSTMRAIEAKSMMDKNLEKIGKYLTPENIFSLLTLSSAIFLTPALYMDAHKWKEAYTYLVNNKEVLKILGRHVLLSGVWFYLYNQLSFISLNRLNHISHAVASTVKRVFLILTSYFIFGTKFSFLGGLGSTMAVSGTFLYSIVKKKFG